MGIKVVSMDFLLESQDTPVVWRGPLKMQVIRQFLSDFLWGELDFLFIDVPPGTSCPVITAIHGTELLVLVTEPTPFGLWDLGLAVEMARELALPIGVIINRAEEGNKRAREFCKEREIRVLAEIPDDRRVAEAYSRGEMICESLPEYESLFMKLLKKVAKDVEIGAELMEMTDHGQKRN